MLDTVGRSLSNIALDYDVNANKFTGELNVEVPIDLASIRASFQPPLKLQYRFAANNGVFGLGSGLAGTPVDGDRHLPRFSAP